MESAQSEQAIARRIEVVVMFTDIVDFTAYSDAHGEEASLAIVTRHENLVFPIVRSHEGTIVKTIGDAVMAYFTDAEKAALAGQSIMKALEEENGGKPETEQMHLRAAFNLGPVMIKNNDLFGDAVNLCSRMMGVGQPDQILISRSMIDRLGDNPKFICRYVGTADFHGKTAVVELYELLAKALELKQKTKSRIVSDTPPGTTADTTKKEKLIGGKYFIEKLIGEGAYGKVFKARLAQDGKPVAIKILPEDAFVIYSREAQVLRQLQPFHYVLEIIDPFVDLAGILIVLPFL